MCHWVVQGKKKFFLLSEAVELNSLSTFCLDYCTHPYFNFLLRFKLLNPSNPMMQFQRGNIWVASRIVIIVQQVCVEHCSKDRRQNGEQKPAFVGLRSQCCTGSDGQWVHYLRCSSRWKAVPWRQMHVRWRQGAKNVVRKGWLDGLPVGPGPWAKLWDWKGRTLQARMPRGTP